MTCFQLYEANQLPADQNDEKPLLFHLKNNRTRRHSLECISPPIRVHRQTDKGQNDQSHNLLQFTLFHWWSNGGDN